MPVSLSRASIIVRFKYKTVRLASGCKPGALQLHERNEANFPVKAHIVGTLPVMVCSSVHFQCILYERRFELI